MPCKTKASSEEMLDQIASYLYQGVTITQAAENLHMSRITFRKWVLRYKEEGVRGQKVGPIDRGVRRSIYVFA